MDADNIKQRCNSLRGAIRDNGADIKVLKDDIRAMAQRGNLPANADTDEMIANAMLAFRHAEDARMRLGKVIQALEGGVSIFDKQPPPENPS
jgi:hypothetical protein